jgi:SAM-dependent methyltransferase
MNATTNDYDASTYGERIASIYDQWYGSFDEASIITLAELARGGRALELGIGTGRIALPLASRGVEVHGIDTSPAMVAQLRAKPGGESIPVTLGDFAGIPVEGEFALIYIPFTTFFALPSQDEQVRCFENVARHLTADGVFVMEVFVPDLTRYARGQCVSVMGISTDQVRIDVAQHDALEQRVTAQHVTISEGGIRLYPVQIRYAWPGELDLMARLAGLRLRHRWSDWQRAPFTAQSQKNISVYERDTSK